MSESLEKVEKVVKLVKGLTNDNNDSESLNTNKISILIIVKCNKDDKFDNNSEIKNDMVNLKKEIEFLKENSKFQRVLGYYYESNKFQDLYITNLEDFINTFKNNNCNITFCGLYGNTCVIKSLVFLADLIDNKNNNYYFSFMGTRFLPMDLFKTYSPSPCNIYLDFYKDILKQQFMRNVPGERDSVLNGKLFDYNIENHKYWIYKSIKGMDFKPNTKISIEILDYKGKPIIEPKGKIKKLKFTLSPYSFFRNFRFTRKNKKLLSNKGTDILDNKSKLKIKEKPRSIEGPVNSQVNSKSILNRIANLRKSRKSGTASGGKNRKTRKIKAKRTRKIRIKKP